MSSSIREPSASEPLIGYCHQCDRQVEIDRESYCCKECNGGFIELFDLERPQAQAQNPGGVRVESIRLNSEVSQHFIDTYNFLS